MKKVLLILLPLLIFTGCLHTKTEKEDKEQVQGDTQILEELTESFVLVEGGIFGMGSNSGYSSEKPVHNVTLSSYYVAKTEVTQAQWTAVMGNNPSYFKGDNRPVEYVSWYDAIVFCNKLSMMDNKTPVYSVDGKTNPDTWGYTPCQGISIRSGTVTMDLKANGYRLPTEAEWEFAAWGGKKMKGYKYSGSDNLLTVAWYVGNSGDQTHDVATKSPNELGLYDMSGNVWEWCWDWYGSYSSSAQTNPVGASSGSCRVVRGGSWYHGRSQCSVSCRDYHYPDDRGIMLGFRLVRNAI